MTTFARSRAGLTALVLGLIAAGCQTGEEEVAASDAAVVAETPIKHVVVIVQENHTFDTYFGRYCKLKPEAARPAHCQGDVTEGAECCEAAPDVITEATFGYDILPRPLGNYSNTSHGGDRNHESACEYAEMNCNEGGARDALGTECQMDRFADWRLGTMTDFVGFSRAGSTEVGPSCGSVLAFRHEDFEEAFVEMNASGDVSFDDLTRLWAAGSSVPFSEWINTDKWHWTASNFAIVEGDTLRTYHDYARQGAIGDRYFQPTVGQTSSNNMFLATAQFEFRDNTWFPDTAGTECQAAALATPPTKHVIKGRETIADLLLDKYDASSKRRDDKGNWVDDSGKPARLSAFGYYHVGYRAMTNPDPKTKDVNGCPLEIAKSCPSFVRQAKTKLDEERAKLTNDAWKKKLKDPGVSCMNDPSDNPFRYYDHFRDVDPSDPTGEQGKYNAALHDYDDLATDVKNGNLPAVTYVKAVTALDEHPAFGPIDAGQDFVKKTVDTILKSPYEKDTLILITWDEGGGFYDHVSPPVIMDPHGEVDAAGIHTNSELAGPGPMRLGTRVPIIALGRFAAKNKVSHVQMEHSSIVKFLEWNFLGKRSGQLKGREKDVNNIGSLLTGVNVPKGKDD